MNSASATLYRWEDLPKEQLKPDLGRRLSTFSEAVLRDVVIKMPEGSIDVLFVVGDGLSSRAVQRNAAGLLDQLIPQLRQTGLSVGPDTRIEDETRRAARYAGTSPACQSWPCTTSGRQPSNAPSAKRAASAPRRAKRS